MSTGWLVTQNNITENILLDLVVLADYFCVPKLAQICSNQLTLMMNIANLNKLLRFGLEFNISNLALSCSDFWIKN